MVVLKSPLISIALVTSILFITPLIFVKFWNNSIISLGTLFNTSFLFFLGSPFIFTAINNDASYLIKTYGSFGAYDFNYYTILTSTLGIVNSYYAIQIGMNVKNFILKSPQYISQNSKKLERISISIFTIGVFGYLINTILKIINVYNNGYLYLFKPESEHDIQGILIIKLGSIFIHTGYALLFSCTLKEINLKIYTRIYATLLLINLFTGQRGESFSHLLTILIIYFSRFNFKVSKKKIAFVIFIFFGLLVGIDLLRSNSKLASVNDIFEIIFGQSRSYLILNNSIIFENELNYILVNLFSEVRSWLYSIQGRIFNIRIDETQSQYAAMRKFGHLGLKLSYLTNEDSFMAGKGTGTSYIAEMYLLGKQKVIFLHGILLGILIKYFSLFRKNVFTNSIGILIIPSILFMPRDSSLNFISNNLISFILILFISYVYRVRCISQKF